MDFMGTYTTADLLASVTSGVQDTTAVLLPMLVFVGIPVAFVIVRYIISLIKSTVGKAK
jgi:hypothetical protein